LTLLKSPVNAANRDLIDFVDFVENLKWTPSQSSRDTVKLAGEKVDGQAWDGVKMIMSFGSEHYGYCLHSS